MGESIVHKFLLILICAVYPYSITFADQRLLDGTYDARVHTQSGTYRVPVEVEDGAVTRILWPNGGRMSVQGGELVDGEAIGRNSRGERIQIELDDTEYDESDESEDN